MESISHNADQIARYLENVWPLIERGSAPPEEPRGGEHKGSSPPATDRALDIMWANGAVTGGLEPILRDARRSAARYEGVYFSDLILETAEDPTAVGRHRDNRNAEGENGRRAKAFFVMCKFLARLAAGDGTFLLRVHTEGDPAQDPRRAGDGQRRSLVAHDSYRRMVADMERRVLSGSHTKEVAKRAKAAELGCSVWRVRDAIKFVNKERRTVFSGTKETAA